MCSGGYKHADRSCRSRRMSPFSCLSSEERPKQEFHKHSCEVQIMALVSVSVFTPVD